MIILTGKQFPMRQLEIQLGGSVDAWSAGVWKAKILVNGKTCETKIE